MPAMADQSLTEYCPAVPHVLPHRACVYSAEHRFARAVDRHQFDLRGSWRDDGVDHQAVLLGAAPIQVWDTRRWWLGKLR